MSPQPKEIKREHVSSFANKLQAWGETLDDPEKVLLQRLVERAVGTKPGRIAEAQWETVESLALQFAPHLTYEELALPKRGVMAYPPNFPAKHAPQEEMEQRSKT